MLTSHMALQFTKSVEFHITEVTMFTFNGLTGRPHWEGEQAGNFTGSMTPFSVLSQILSTFNFFLTVETRILLDTQNGVFSGLKPLIHLYY